MTVAFITLLIMTIILSIMAYRRKDGTHIRGLIMAKGMAIGIIPLLLIAFLIAGLIQVAIPPEVIRTWLGEESGWRGIILGTVVGALIPAGPYMAFPIIAAIFSAGASLGTAVALITSWALRGVGQIPFELAFIGPRFMGIRLCTSFLFPPLAGCLAQLFFGGGF